MVNSKEEVVNADELFRVHTDTHVCIYKAWNNTALMLKAITPFKASCLVLHQESTPGK